MHFTWSIFKKIKKFFSARRGDRIGCVIFTVYNQREADFTHGGGFSLLFAFFLDKRANRWYTDRYDITSSKGFFYEDIRKIALAADGRSAVAFAAHRLQG